MKKFLIISASGIIVGSLFAFYMFSNINKTMISFKNEETVTAFQVGVYSIYENAKKVADDYQNSYIFKDEDKYRVFLAIYQDEEIINYMRDYYEKNNINIYLKEMNLEDNKYFLEQLNKYENLLKKSTNKDTYISANKNILGEFAKTL